jgi:hypothetical protein
MAYGPRRGRAGCGGTATSRRARSPVRKQSGLILVGRSVEAGDLIQRWQTERPRLVMMQIDVIDDLVLIDVRDPRLDSLLNFTP